MKRLIVALVVTGAVACGGSEDPAPANPYGYLGHCAYEIRSCTGASGCQVIHTTSDPTTCFTDAKALTDYGDSQCSQYLRAYSDTVFNAYCTKSCSGNTTPDCPL